MEVAEGVFGVEWYLDSEVKIMSEQQPPAAPQNNSNQDAWPEPDAEELRLLEEHLEELRKQGVIIKGDGIRGTIRAEMAKKPAGEATSGEEAESEELRQLYRQLAQLRARGIVSGGEGPRESLRPTARAPGALARFLAAGR